MGAIRRKGVRTAKRLPVDGTNPELTPTPWPASTTATSTDTSPRSITRSRFHCFPDAFGSDRDGIANFFKALVAAVPDARTPFGHGV